MANLSVSMKLLIDTQGKRVLFAEAGKDCVDLLFRILSLPLAKVITLLGKQEMVGSVSNLYESLENLNSSYIQPNKTKDTLLKPVSPITGYSVPLLTIDDMPDSKNLYNESGFVKGGVVMYMVTDDLVVLPMCTVSTNTVLNKLDVKDVGVLEEKVVSLGMVEAVKLLKASLETKDVLTRVFVSDLGSSTLLNQCTENEATMVSKKTICWFETMSNKDDNFPILKFELEDEACVYELENETQLTPTFSTKACVSESINEAQLTSTFSTKACVSESINEAQLTSTFSTKACVSEYINEAQMTSTSSKTYGKRKKVKKRDRK